MSENSKKAHFGPSNPSPQENEKSKIKREQGMQFNMGQWLSIPLVAIGLLFMALSKRNKSSL